MLLLQRNVHNQTYAKFILENVYEFFVYPLLSYSIEILRMQQKYYFLKLKQNYPLMSKIFITKMAECPSMAEQKRRISLSTGTQSQIVK